MDEGRKRVLLLRQVS